MKTINLKLLLLISYHLLDETWQVQVYQFQIPNGQRVPNPCDRTLNWNGVGHELPQGGGPNNPFGRDFALAGRTWTVDLCSLDSDQDGMTNGEELGDPYCQWVDFGALPNITNRDNLTHPGICEPITSLACLQRNQFLANIDVCLVIIGSTLAPLPTTTSNVPAVTVAPVVATTGSSIANRIFISYSELFAMFFAINLFRVCFCQIQQLV